MKQRLSFAGVVLVLLSCIGGAARAETVLTVFAQAYTPEISTGDNPKPLKEMTRLARAFERLHPGVRVRFLKNPVGEYRTWMRTQLQGGIAPDIMWAHSTWCNEDARYGWFANLDPYLAQPNPYCAPGMRGSKHWLDLFYADATNAKRAPDGHLYALPIDQVETAIYYNKDLFRRAGVQEPRTWAEFIAVQQRLRQAGIIPFLMTAQQEMRLSWAQTILADQLWADRLPQMDARTGGAGFPGVDEQEFIRAYKRGIFSLRDPRHREQLRLLKEWSQYWQAGALAANDDRLFRLGRAAMWWDGSWYASQIARDPMRAFEFGIFLVPPLTKSSSPYASGQGAKGVGGATSIQYAITNTAMRGRKVALAVDFLRFITAPQNLGPLVSEAGLFLPNVVGLEGSPLLKPFQKVLEAGHVRFGGVSAGPVYSAQSFRILQGYLGGQFTEEETLQRLEKYLAEGVEQTLRDNAKDWRFSADWAILPAPASLESPGPQTQAPRSRSAMLGIGLVSAALLGAVLLRPGGRRALRRHRASYLFLTPTFLLLILFTYYPILSALAHSFTEWKGSGAAAWIGLDNFREMLRDDILLDSVGNMVWLLLAGILISVTVPLAVAEMIFALRGERAQYLYRVLFVIPMVVPGVVILLIWGFIYDNNLGLLNQALDALGLGAWKHAWLGEPGLALYALMFMGFPWVGGFGLLIYYAGLQNIPQDVFDSARIDGAKGLARFRSIDLPLLMGQVKLLVVLGFIGGLQGFQTQLLLTNGGPAFATMVPGMHMYQNAIAFDRMGYACAIGVVLFLVILAITYLNVKYIRSSVEYQP